MPFVGSTVARTRSRVATAHRQGDPEKITEARRDHAAAKLETYVARVVDEAPPLTEEQLDRITGLLRGGGRLAG